MAGIPLPCNAPEIFAGYEHKNMERVGSKL